MAAYLFHRLWPHFPLRVRIKAMKPWKVAGMLAGLCPSRNIDLGQSFLQVDESEGSYLSGNRCSTGAQGYSWRSLFETQQGRFGSACSHCAECMHLLEQRKISVMVQKVVYILKSTLVFIKQYCKQNTNTSAVWPNEPNDYFMIYRLCDVWGYLC